MCGSCAVSVGSCARECSAAQVKLGERTTEREGERERELSRGKLTLLLFLSLFAAALWRACTMRCFAECIFNMVGVADAHFANWNVYKPGEQLPQYSLLFTFASGLVSFGRSGVWFGPQRTNERKHNIKFVRLSLSLRNVHTTAKVRDAFKDISCTTVD